MIGPLVAIFIQASGGGILEQADELLMQSTNRIFDGEEALGLAIGRCARIYPAGASDPYALQARQAVRDIGMNELTMSSEQLFQLRLAEGSQQASSYRATPAQCLAQISDAAEDLEQDVRGLEGLMTTLDRASRAEAGS